jgi:hypothetical protein
VTQLLWRIEGTSPTPNLDGWQEGLILHLLFQSLTLVVARRDGQTRRYVVVEGCSSCRVDGCERICHRVLFEQLVRTTLPGVTLIPTARLVPRASESRHVLATPRHTTARLLDEAFLAQWAEGCLIVTWSRLRASAQPVTVGAQLVVSSDGPMPTKALEEAGWRALPVASLISRRAQTLDVPQSVRVGARVGEALFVALRDPRTWTGSEPTPACATDEDLKALGEQAAARVNTPALTGGDDT